MKILAPRDPEDAMDVILEIKAGEGGEESALFASDLARMYGRYAEAHGWSVTEMSATHTELGGFKDITLAIRAKGTPAPDEGVWAHLNTRAASTACSACPSPSRRAVFTRAPQAFSSCPRSRTTRRSSSTRTICASTLPFEWPGRPVGEHDGLRRAHHAYSVRHRCLDAEREIAAAEQGGGTARAGLAPGGRSPSEEGASLGQRLSQVRTVDRSERIRTYNFPENRIADHRTGFKAHNLDAVLSGALDAVIASLQEADEAERLAAATQS